MKLFAGKVTPIATEAVRALLAAENIESAAPREVERDIESVLKNYLDIEREVNERAKDLMERTGRGQGDFNRLRGLVADEKGIKVGDDTLDYLLDQVVEIFHHSANVDEIYCEDVELRRKMAPIFKKHMGADALLDGEARAHMKNLQEGSREWEIEYQRQMDLARRKKGLG